MISVKRFFNTPKKAVISTICIVMLVLIGIVVISTTAIKNLLISKSEASDIALADAGLNASEASALRAKLDFDDGRFQYEVDFYNNGTEYEYVIQAKDGDIIARDIEGDRNGEDSTQPQKNNAYDSTEKYANHSNSNYIGVDRAKEITLNHANLSETDVQFTKAKLENDDGKMEYEIELYFDNAEYSYTIDAVSGDILEYDVDFD